MSRTLSIDFLRTFIAIADAGTFAAAAERVGRTVSAVSLQIDRLEEQVGRALFQKSGRRMEPTSAGRQLLDHARTILAANDAALSAMSSDRLSGTVRLGVLHDGIEAAAATVLADFIATHPDARIEVVVDTSQALIDAMEAGKLDQAITFQVNTRLPRDTLGLVPMRWIGNRQRSLIDDQRPLPLVMLEEPCAFRRAALAALDEAGIPWRIVLVSASLAAVRAAVGAGLGITVRTAEFIQSLGGGAHEIERLPKLPQKQLCLYRRVPVITSRTGNALHRECLEKLKVG
jgi:DNA-binding transcriptional LysR family regulator